MKKKLLLIIIFSSLSVYSADWDLFPFKQKLFFLENAYPNYFKDANLLLMDSVKTNGQDTILYFRKNLNLHGAGTCYIDTLQEMNWSLYDFFHIDSLLQRNDTVSFFSTYSSTPFYFLPKAAVGQSWTVTSTFGGNDYNQISISCSGIALETFLGITDSVKTFSLTPNGSSVNQTPVNNYNFKLSKNYGLINFVPFILFLYHPGSVDFNSVQLIGLDSSGIQYGYQQPEFADYFHLNIGDILLWERHYDPAGFDPGWSEYYQDSITQTFFSYDSIIYTYNRIVQDMNNVITHQNGRILKILRSEFANIVEAPPYWIGLGNNVFGQSFSSNSVLFWRTIFLELKINAINGDTISTYAFDSDASAIDTTSCQIGQVTDMGFSFTIDTRAGFIHSCYYNMTEDCITLIGSRINGEQVGNIYLSNNDFPTSKNFRLEIYPNPASNLINIRNITNNRKTDYQVFNCVGKLFEEGSLHDNKISTNHFSSGLYFIRLNVNNEIMWGKFIKE